MPNACSNNSARPKVSEATISQVNLFFSFFPARRHHRRRRLLLLHRPLQLAAVRQCPTVRWPVVLHPEAVLPRDSRTPVGRTLEQAVESTPAPPGGESDQGPRGAEQGTQLADEPFGAEVCLCSFLIILKFVSSTFRQHVELERNCLHPQYLLVPQFVYFVTSVLCNVDKLLYSIIS